MADLKKFLTVYGGATRNSTSFECGLFGGWGPVLAWSAFTAGYVELPDAALTSESYFVGDVVWVPSNVGEVFDLLSFDRV